MIHFCVKRMKGFNTQVRITRFERFWRQLYLSSPSDFRAEFWGTATRIEKLSTCVSCFLHNINQSSRQCNSSHARKISTTSMTVSKDVYDTI